MKYMCDACDATYFTASALRNHKVNKHMKVKETFLCTFCGKGFTKKANLESHITLHTGEKRYNCTHCDKSSGLIQFIRTIYDITKERPSCKSHICSTRNSSKVLKVLRENLCTSAGSWRRMLVYWPLVGAHVYSVILQFNIQIGYWSIHYYGYTYAMLQEFSYCPSTNTIRITTSQVEDSVIGCCLISMYMTLAVNRWTFMTGLPASLLKLWCSRNCS